MSLKLLSSLLLRQSSKHHNAWDESKFVFVFLFVCFFNGWLNFQIWHHKAKTQESHPEAWCRLDCGRFRRGFSSFCFSITMLKTRWNSARCKVYSISHFFFFFSFASSISQNSGGEKKKPAVFSFISRTWCRGMRAEVGQHRKFQKINKNKEKNKRKSKQNKHTHRENEHHQLMNWKRRKKKKKYRRWWVDSKVSYVLHEVLCSDLWPLCKSGVCVCGGRC